MKQEVEPSFMHGSSIDSQLRTQYPYLDLCKTLFLGYMLVS